MIFDLGIFDWLTLWVNSNNNACDIYLSQSSQSSPRESIRCGLCVLCERKKFFLNKPQWDQKRQKFKNRNIFRPFFWSFCAYWPCEMNYLKIYSKITNCALARYKSAQSGRFANQKFKITIQKSSGFHFSIQAMMLISARTSARTSVRMLVMMHWRRHKWSGISFRIAIRRTHRGASLPWPQLYMQQPWRQPEF